MSNYVPGKSKFKALRNIGLLISKHEIGTFERQSSDSLPGHLVIKFESDPDLWCIAESSMAPCECDLEPAVKYIGERL